MKIQIKSQVTETKTVEVEPGYYKGKLLSETFYHLSPGGTLIYVSKTVTSISLPNSYSHAREIQELVKDYIPCDKSVFDAAKDEYLCHLAHYVSFPELATAVNPALKEGVYNNMKDPNVNDPANQVSPAPETATTEQAEQATETETAEGAGALVD